MRKTGSALFYFNSPESIRTPGVVGEATLPSGQRSRIFFHFVNKTHQSQPFEVALDSPLSACILGIAVDQEPGTAGTLATARYLAHKIKPQVDVIKQDVPPGATISGILEGETLGVAHVICSMGTGPGSDWDVAEGAANLTLETETGKSLWIGTDESPVQGAYGTTHHSLFANNEQHEQHVIVYISPRGGPARFVYLYKGVVHKTDVIPARCSILLLKDTLRIGETLELDTIPVGGYSYPIKITCKIAR